MRTTIDYGIDLGTTNSAIARQRGAAPELVRGPTGQAILPSAVHVAADAKLTVGAAALAAWESDAANTAIEFKRLMGTGETKHFPNSDRSLSPEELSAEVLRELLRWAASADGAAPVAAVITIPAMFQLPQCEATRKAARLAGIQHAPLLQEPIAAAIAHSGSGELGEGYWMVYDLGGGTFDVSLVRSKAGRLQVLDHDGDNHLGGRDFDRLLARRAADKVREDGRLGEFKRTDTAYVDAFPRLKAEAERVRIQLSQDSAASFRVEAGGRRRRRLLARARRARGAHPADRPAHDGAVPEAARAQPRGRQGAERARHGRRPFAHAVVPRLIRASSASRPATCRSDDDRGQRRGAVRVDAAAPGRAAPGRARRRAGSSARVRVDDHGSGAADGGPLDPRGAAGGPRRCACAARRRLRVAGHAARRAGRLRRRPGAAPGTCNVFALEARAGARRWPSSRSRSTCSTASASRKPPLSQSVGVMLADNNVAWYLRKGAVLPARHAMTHATTTALVPGSRARPSTCPCSRARARAPTATR